MLRASIATFLLRPLCYTTSHKRKNFQVVISPLNLASPCEHTCLVLTSFLTMIMDIHSQWGKLFFYVIYFQSRYIINFIFVIIEILIKQQVFFFHCHFYQIKLSIHFIDNSLTFIGHSTVAFFTLIVFEHIFYISSDIYTFIFNV